MSEIPVENQNPLPDVPKFKKEDSLGSRPPGEIADYLDLVGNHAGAAEIRAEIKAEAVSNTLPIIKPFEEALALVNQAAVQLAECENKHQAALDALDENIMACVQEQHTHFGGLWDDRDVPDTACFHDKLFAVNVTEDNLIATYLYSGSGQDDYYIVMVPLRYLKKDGLAAMLADAQALRTKQDSAFENKLTQIEQEEYKTFLALRAKFEGKSIEGR